MKKLLLILMCAVLLAGSMLVVQSQDGVCNPYTDPECHLICTRGIPPVCVCVVEDEEVVCEIPSDPPPPPDRSTPEPTTASMVSSGNTPDRPFVIQFRFTRFRDLIFVR